MDATTSKNKQGEHVIEVLDNVFDAAVQANLNSFKEITSQTLSQLSTPNNNTILHIHIAARSKSAESFHFVKQILEMCPLLLWQVNNQDQTLLHFAARHGHGDIVKLLVEESKSTGGDVRKLLSWTCKTKDTALHEALRHSCFEVAEFLVNEDPGIVYAANGVNESPLYLAAERGIVSLVSTMLDYCKAPDHTGPLGRTTLHAAVIHNDEKMTQLILEKTRTKLTKKGDKEGWVPLHYASNFGYYSIARQLLETDNNAAYVADTSGKTALHIAASLGHLSIVEDILSSCPGSSGSIDKSGRNVFHFAMESKSERLVEFLYQQRFLHNLLKRSYVRYNVENFSSNKKTEIQAAKSKASAKTSRNDPTDNGKDVAKGDIVKETVDYLMSQMEESGSNDNRGRNNVKSKEESKKEKDNNRDRHKVKAKEVSNKEKDIAFIKDAKEAHLLVATLIATVAFTAGITMPGGYKQDGPNQGKAVLVRNAAFKAFVVTNTMALLCSSFAVFINMFITSAGHQVVRRLLLNCELPLITIAMFLMVTAFTTGSCAVLAHSLGLAIFTAVFGGVYLATFLISALSATLIKTRNQTERPETGWSRVRKHFIVQS